MILKTAANYNDEGGYIEAWKNSDGTTEVKLIPKSGDEKQGLKSITISPAITTTPALDSITPIYWDDLTDEQKENGIQLTLAADSLISGNDYDITITPSSDWYAAYTIGDDTIAAENRGEPLTATAQAAGDDPVEIRLDIYANNDPEMPTEMVIINVVISTAQ